jgi:cob(I)alamin adenosyltransferase
VPLDWITEVKLSRRGEVMKRRGLICIYTGGGKGKSTAAFGAALRAAGQGLKVLILQFMKGQKNIGEIKALKDNNLSIELRQFGRPLFFQTRTCEAIDIKEAARGLDAFLSAVKNRKYDLIILDEINIAIHFNLISFDEIKKIIDIRPPDLHLLFTGRNAPQELVQMADLVTEMREIKHPFREGIQAQAGIEF